MTLHVAKSCLLPLRKPEDKRYSDYAPLRGLHGLHVRRTSASGAPPPSPAQMNTVEEGEEKEASSPELNLEPEPEPELLMPRP